MKIRYTDSLMSTVYAFCRAEDIYFRRSWGVDESWNTDIVTAIDGAIAEKQAKELHMQICSPLQPGVGYIFRFTKAGKLYPYHISMLPKTAANIEKGSSRYGSVAILAEI